METIYAPNPLKMSERFNDDQLEVASNVFKSIAHPIRIKIINELISRNKLNVSEICNHLQLEQPLASHHLGILKRAGIVESKRNGREIIYQLAIVEMVTILECIESCFK